MYAIDTENLIAPSVLSDKKVKFSIASGCNIPYEDNFFDCVYSIDVIEYVENDALFIKENIRVLKNGGILIIGTPNRHLLPQHRQKIVDVDYAVILRDSKILYISLWIFS